MKNVFTLIITLWCLVLVSTISASEDFSKKIDELLNQHNLPGLVLLIKQDNKIVYDSAHGLVNIDKEKRIEKDAIFRIFSMSKPITAFALLQLVDRGEVSLQDDIRKFLPNFDPFEINGQEYKVTVHHLLTHTAGMGYGGGFKNWEDFRYLISHPLSRNNTLEELVDDISGIDLKYVPGNQWQYSIASDVQGALIEAISGMRLDNYLHKNIFVPLEMQDTDFFVPQRKKHRLVDMYEYTAKTFEEAYQFNADKIKFEEKAAKSKYLKQTKLLSGGGGLLSTARDYDNFVTMLLNKGQYKGVKLLSENLVDKMLSSQTKNLDMSFLPRVYPSAGFGYGIGVSQKDEGGRSEGSFFWAGMGGTIFWADPKKKLSVVAMMQLEDGWLALEKWLIPNVYALLESEND